MAPTVEEKMVVLASKLLQETEAQNVSWNVANSGEISYGARAPHAFRVVLGAGAALVRNIDGDGAFPFEFAALNGVGQEIEALRTNSRDREPAGEFDQLLLDLYTAARRSAFAVGATLDDLLNALD